MTLSWSSRQLKLKAKFAAFGRQQIAPRAKALSRQNTFDQQSWQSLTEAGFWNPILPQRFTGQAPDWWEFSAALEGLAENLADGGFLWSVIAQAGAIRGLSELGSATQIDSYMPRLQAGALTATCIAEPQSGTDSAGIRTQVVEDENGNWQLQGRKFNISHAPNAEIFLVLGRLPGLGKRDISLLIFDADRPGLLRGEAEAKMGNRTLPTGSLHFEGLPLDEGNVLGKPGGGFRSLGQVAGLTRCYFGWMGAQLLRPVLEEALAFLQDRASGGQKLLERQYVQGKLTDVMRGLYESRWLGMGSLSQLLEGHPEAGMTGSMARLRGGEALIQGSQNLLSLMGSRGYQESLASRLVQDAMGMFAIGGTTEMHQMNIFHQFMRLQVQQ